VELRFDVAAVVVFAAAGFAAGLRFGFSGNTPPSPAFTTSPSAFFASL
jgi:hypothetical protein